MRCPVGALACALAAIPAKAPELGLPLACIPGADCWAVRYVDHDTGPTAADYSCGVLSSDGHDGTDVAIADPARMREGVPVLAVANGTVRRVRDGVADQPAHGRLDHDFAGLNCGNGVVVEHAGGWETQYCHLRSGSVRVGPGQSVAAGQAIGLVGMSGEANFPHVHLSVRRDGVAIDPFTGGAMTEPCGQPGAPLWRQDLRAELTYLEVPIAVVGLTDRVPSRDEIVAGTAASDTLRAASPALVGYVLAYGLRPGDLIEIAITGPGGTEISRVGFMVDEEAPRATRSAGRRTPPQGWAPGRYRVEASVRRDGRHWASERMFTLIP